MSSSSSFLPPEYIFNQRLYDKTLPTEFENFSIVPLEKYYGIYIYAVLSNHPFTPLRKNTTLLLHGTDEPYKVLRDGFDTRFIGKTNAYGKGFYFSDMLNQSMFYAKKSKYVIVYEVDIKHIHLTSETDKYVVVTYDMPNHLFFKARMLLDLYEGFNAVDFFHDANFNMNYFPVYIPRNIAEVDLMRIPGVRTSVYKLLYNKFLSLIHTIKDDIIDIKDVKDITSLPLESFVSKKRRKIELEYPNGLQHRINNYENELDDDIIRFFNRNDYYFLDWPDIDDEEVDSQ